MNPMSLFGGGMSASSSAKSGDASGGAFGSVSVGGINTGTQGGMPSWLIPAALAVVALYFVSRRR